MPTKEELQKQLNDIQEQIQALPDDKPSSVFVPEKGNSIFFTNRTGNIVGESYCPYDSHHQHLVKAGLASPTASEAIKARDKAYLLQEMRVFANFEPDWDDKKEVKWSFKYVHHIGEWEGHEWMSIQHSYYPVCATAERRDEMLAKFGDRMTELLV